ncbi:MAG: YihA family ribosome biogenesis GTP-binding protein, partial [Acidobacteriota bacterium]
GRRLLVVLTKADKLSRGALMKEAARIGRDLELRERPLAFSAQTGEGRKEVLAAIAQALAA